MCAQKTVYICKKRQYNRNQYFFKMRFSSDQEIYNEQSVSKNQKSVHENDKQQSESNQPKNSCNKKQTLLSRFLSLIDQESMKMMSQYQKHKRPVFEKQIKSFVPPKISLYEDVLIMSVFKQNEQNIRKDHKMIKVICTDLQSRTKRKQCTIKERIQKKLCKLTLPQLKQHIKRGMDFTFNSKKIISSGSKTCNNSDKKISTSQNEEIKVKSENTLIQNSQKLQTEKVAQNEMEVEKQAQHQIIDNEKEIQGNKNLENQKLKQVKETNKTFQNCIVEQEFYKHNQIMSSKIFFKFTPNTQTLVLFQPQCIAQQLNLLLQQSKKQNQNKKKIEKLKTQLNFINQLVNKNNINSLSSQIKNLLEQAKLISNQIYELSDAVKLKNNHNFIDSPNQKQMHKNNQEKLLDQQQTSLKREEQNGECKKGQVKSNQHIQVSNFQETQNDQIANLAFKLCNNKTYIKLFENNPQALQPLLWSDEQDQILINIQASSQVLKCKKLIQCLIRYKSIQWVIERFIFLKLKMSEKIFDLLMGFNPLCVDILKSYWQQSECNCQQGKVGYMQKQLILE